MLVLFAECKRYAEGKGIRLVFHPDQLVVLNSPKKTLLRSRFKIYCVMPIWLSYSVCDVINIPGGGVYGDKNRSSNRSKLGD